MSTAETTWELIASGDLFSPKKLDELKAEFTRQPPGKSDVLKWLMDRKEITDYHSKVFAAGHSGPFRYGDYVVNDRITEGYFKGGFRATHSETNHPVVLSFVTDEEASVHWPRLKAMAAETQYFSSPFLVRCFEADETDEFKFLVFEDFDSVPITAILAKSGHLKPKTACDVVRRIALALQTIHQAGYSHGHVSSQHVRIQGGSVVKLFFDPNYFFVPLVKANQTPDPLSLAQVDYSAPELGYPGSRPDELTDIYALGCLFYELLVGKPPFPIGNIQDRIQQHATERVKPLENLGYDKNLAQFVYFMMAKDRKIRFQTIADVIKQLNALPDSGNFKPASPKALDTYTRFDQSIRAKLSNENLHTHVPPTNLLPPTASGSPAPPASSEPAPKPTAPEAPTPAPASTGAFEPTMTEATSAPGAMPFQVGEEHANTSSSFRSRQRKSLKKTLIPVGITLLVLAIPLYFVYLKYGDQMFGATAENNGNTEQKGEGDNNKNEGNGTSEKGNGEQGNGAQVTNVNLIEDDQRTLWEGPTSGDPLTTELTPAGMRLLLSVRGESLFSKDTDSLLVKSLGPDFMEQTKLLETAAGISWKEAKRVNFSIHDNNVEGQDNLLGAFVVEPVDQKNIVYWLAKWGDCTKQETGKGDYYNSTNGWSYYTADSDKISRFLVGPESLVKSVVEEGEGLMPMGMPVLLKQTDRDRHLNLLVVPKDLTSPSGVTMFKPSWLKLNRIMSWYVGGEDKIQAAYLSMHFDGEDVYLETGMKPQLDKDPYTLADELRTRLSEAPKMVDDYLLDVDADRHWKKLAREIPDWIKSVSSMARVGVENKITIANCWQENTAAHNLLAGLEYTLTFAEGSAGATEPAVPVKKTPQTLDELLADVRTIEIGNDDLNIAVDKIVAEVKDDYPKLPFDFKIIINGTHLMDEGITKNQRLVNFKVEKKPLGDILAQFVFTATTDKTATGPSDPKTMLIWVTHEMEPGKPIVLITTRTAATREGYKLPKQFVPQ